MKRVLVGCEFSQVVTKAFRDRGFEAFSCDFEPPEINPKWHIQGDVLEILDDGWDLGIFHPTCTYICNSGSSHLYIDKRKGNGLNIPRWFNLIEGALFFKKLLNAPIPHVAVENPVMLGYAKKIIGQSQSQTIQPYEHGDPESKRTCLWLKNLPKIQPTEICEPEWIKNPDGSEYRDNGGYRYSQSAYDPKPRWRHQTPSGQNKLGPSPDRWKLRSKTYPGIAKAFAKQWGDYILIQ